MSTPLYAHTCTQLSIRVPKLILSLRLSLRLLTCQKRACGSSLKPYHSKWDSRMGHPSAPHRPEYPHTLLCCLAWHFFFLLSSSSFFFLLFLSPFLFFFLLSSFSFFFVSSSVFSGCNINVLFNLRVSILTQPGLYKHPVRQRRPI